MPVPAGGVCGGFFGADELRSGGQAVFRAGEAAVPGQVCLPLSGGRGPHVQLRELQPP